MERLWLITNPGSGSTSDAKCAAIEALIEERGLTIVGRTHFPADALPAAERLAAERVDTIVLFAGDGTINAAACALDGFAGEVLILPGGTMNMLAKRLHGDADPHAIIHAAHERPRTIRLPLVQVGAHRAFIAAIIGPAATWGRAREALREGRLRRMWQAARLAWRRSFGRSVAVVGEPALRGRHQALIVTPGADRVTAATADARHLAQVVRLGVSWLLGDWHTDAGVRTACAARLVVTARRPIDALFDGEPATLDAPVEVTGGETRLRFLTTL